MKVCVSVKGRFHGFYLANQLQKRDALVKLITTYPVFETIKYGIKKDLIDSLFMNEIIERIWRKFPRALEKIWNGQYFFHELHDIRAAKRIPDDCDIFVSFSSSSLHSITKAHEKGIITVLERGSSHIQYQKQLLLEEYERCHIKPPAITHSKIIEKEMREYEVTDYISVPSTFVKNSLVEKGIPENKIIQIPYGVNLTHFYPHAKNDDIFRIIFCGNRSLRKGVQYLLQAFAELKLPKSELWFIGSETDDIKRYIKLYSGENIYYKGPFPEFELSKYYSQGSVFCLPSIEEGLAMVIPQAMACGLPVICTTNTGGGDIVRDGKDGFVIPIRDIDALKEKILYLYNHREICADMGQSAKQRVQAGFSWNDYGERMFHVYQRILNQK